MTKRGGECCLDARFTVEDQARIGMVEANVAHGPIWFNSNPDLTISLENRVNENLDSFGLYENRVFI